MDRAGPGVDWRTGADRRGSPTGRVPGARAAPALPTSGRRPRRAGSHRRRQPGGESPPGTALPMRPPRSHPAGHSPAWHRGRIPGADIPALWRLQRRFPGRCRHRGESECDGSWFFLGIRRTATARPAAVGFHKREFHRRGARSGQCRPSR